MLAFTSVRDDVPLEDVTRDLERLSHEAQAADQPGARRRRAEGAGSDPQGRRRSGQGHHGTRRALGSAGRFRRHLDRAGRASRRSARRARGADEADHAGRPISSTTKRCARSSSRKRARSSTGARRPARASHHSPGDLPPADHRAACLPHPEGQLAHGRPEGLRRGGLGLRAGLQHAARRAAPGRAAADRVRGLGARRPRPMGRGDRGRQRRARAAKARSRSPPTASCTACRAAKTRSDIDLPFGPAAEPAEPCTDPDPGATVAAPPPEPGRSRPRSRSSSTCRASTGPSRGTRRPSACRRRRRLPTSPMFERFDDARDDAMQTTLANSQFVADAPTSRSRLDLDSRQPAPSAACRFERAGTAPTARADLPGDDASPAPSPRPRPLRGDADADRQHGRPPHARRSTRSDPELDRRRRDAAASNRAPTPQRTPTSTSRSSARCGSASRSSTSTSTRPTSCRAA